MRDFVRLSDEEIRQQLQRGSYLTVDHHKGQAFLHAQQVTSPVPMTLFHELHDAGSLEQVNADDVSTPIAIYRQHSGRDAGSYGSAQAGQR